MSIWSEDELRDFTQNVVPSISKEGVEAFESHQRDPTLIIEALFRSAEEPSLSSRHKMAAFRAVAGFLEQGIRTDGSIRQCCATSDTYQRALQIYLDKSDGYTSGPMQRLLSILATILRVQTSEQSRENVRGAVLQCLTSILDHDNPEGVKPSMLLLTKFLNSDCLSPRQLLVHLEDVPGTTVQSSDGFGQRGQTFIYNILEWIGLNHASISATGLVVRFCKLCEHMDDLPEPAFKSADLWLAPVRRLVDQDDSMFEVLERHALPDLFQINIDRTFEALKPRVKEICITHGRYMSDFEVRLCLMALKKAGSNESFLVGDTAKSNSTTVFASRHSMVMQIAQHLLLHRSSKIRTNALELITTAYKLPQHIPEEILSKTLTSLRGFHGEGDVQARIDFLNVARRLVSRIEGSISRLRRDFEKLEQAVQEDPTDGATQALLKANTLTLKRHEEFAAGYADVLADGLRPSAPYQQHISCLKMVEMLVDSSRSFPWHEKLCFPLTQTFITLIMDSYDDVRAAASVVVSRMLSNPPSPSARAQLHDRLILAVLRAEDTICRAQRADLADGYGRLHSVWHETCPDPSSHVDSILQKLENDIAIASADLNLAVTSAPIQGHLIALRYILSRKGTQRAFETQHPGDLVESFHHRLRDTFQQVWEIVRPILCIDSPDGTNLLDPESAKETDMKDTLSYAWRALKETSALMQAIVYGTSYANRLPSGALQYDDYKVIGDLTFIQLAQLRHKGAFSTVAQTYITCCVVCSKSPDNQVSELVDEWFQEMLQCIELKANALTRRSAGIPSIAIGIFIARKNQGSIDSTFKDLQNIAQQQIHETAPISESRLPQVHALNCLKEAVTHTSLGLAVEAHIPALTQLAAQCLESEAWAIRNCGLMLLKALITRLRNGSATSTARSADKYRTYSKNIYEKFPSLSDLVAKLLTRSTRLMQDMKPMDDQDFLCENGLPALQIISRLGVVPRDRPTIKTLLARNLKSPIWNIRVLAARCLSTIVDMGEIFDGVKTTLSQATPSTNLIHGYLSCLQEYVHARPSLAEEILRELLILGPRLATPRACPFVLVVYLQNICLALRRCYEVSQVKMKSDDLISINGQQFTFARAKQDLQQRLAGLTVNGLPAELLEAIASTAALLERCELPGPRGEKEYPLKSYHPTADMIPKLSAIALGDINSTNNDELTSIRMSLDLYFSLKQTHDETSSSNQVLDWISNLVSSHASQKRVGKSLTGEPDPNSMDLAADKLRHSRDAMMKSARHEDDEAYAQQLVFHGAALTFETHIRSEKLHQYTKMLQLALQADSEYVERYAAIASMGHYIPLVDLGDLCKDHVTMYTLLLTSLSDDDDDIRYLTAEVVYTLFLRQTHHHPHSIKSREHDAAELSLCPFTPVAAKDTLVSLLTQGIGLRPFYLGHCMSAITGEDIDPCWAERADEDRQPLTDLIRSSNSIFIELTREKDTSLFEVERTILFIDEVQDMELWKEAFKSSWAALISKPTLSKPVWMVNDAEDWLLPGLKEMREYIEQERAASLLASSIREVFVYGMRLLILAEAITYVSRKFLQKELESISTALKELRDIGTTKDIDDHWMRKIDTILDSSG